MDKQQIKARFFGAHIGCDVRVESHETFANDDYILRGVGDTGLVFYLFKAKFDNCKLILRPLSSITLDECRSYVRSISVADDVEEAAKMLYKGLRPTTSEATDTTHCRFIDYVRSINICVPFCGLDPVSEGWVVLEG